MALLLALMSAGTFAFAQTSVKTNFQFTHDDLEKSVSKLKSMAVEMVRFDNVTFVSKPQNTNFIISLNEDFQEGQTGTAIAEFEKDRMEKKHELQNAVGIVSDFLLKSSNPSHCLVNFSFLSTTANAKSILKNRRIAVNDFAGNFTQETNMRGGTTSKTVFRLKFTTSDDGSTQNNEGGAVGTLTCDNGKPGEGYDLSIQQMLNHFKGYFVVTGAVLK